MCKYLNDQTDCRADTTAKGLFILANISTSITSLLQGQSYIQKFRNYLNDGASFCCCAYVLRISTWSEKLGFVKAVPTNTKVFSGRGPYSTPRAQFFPIRTSRSVNNIYIFFSVRERAVS